MRLLIIDDNSEDRRLAIRELQKQFPDAEFLEIAQRADFERAMTRFDFDAVITDYELNWADGLWVLLTVTASFPDVPVIMFTGTGNEEIAVKGMKAGLSDYVLKCRPARLPVAVRESLEKARLRRKQEDAIRKLRLSEERSRSVSELTSDHTFEFRVQPDGTVEPVSVVEGLTDVTEGSLKSLSDGWAGLIHPDDMEAAMQNLTRLLSGDRITGELRTMAEDRAIRWVRYVARPIKDVGADRVIRFVGAASDITEQKRVHEHVALTMSLLSATLESTADGILVVDREGKITSFNQKFLEMWGIPDSVIASGADDKALAFVLDQLNDPAGFLQKVKDLYTQPEAESYDVLEFKDGRTFERYSKPQRIGGKCVGRVWSFRDVTEHRRAEAALRQSQQQYQVLMDSIDGIVWECDARTFEFFFVSRQAERLLGYPVEQWLNESAFYRHHIHPDDANWVFYACAKAAREEGRNHEFEYRMIAADGRTVWVRNILTVVAENPGVLKLRGLMVDITERKHAQKALHESEERYRTLAENSAVGIWQVDVDGHTIYLNPAMCSILEVNQPEEMAGRTYHAFFAPEGLVKVDQARVDRLRGRASSYEAEMIGKQGRRRSILISGAPIFGADGQLRSLIGTFTDITDRKLAESLLAGQKRVLEMIASGASLPDILDVLARVMEAQADGMLCSFLLLDQDGRSLRHGAAPSLPEAYTRGVDGIAIGPCAGACGTAAYRGELVVISDIASDPLCADWRDFGLRFGLRACWSMPIISTTGQVLGTFAVYYRAPRNPDPQDLQRMDIATHLAKIAIEHKRAEVALKASEERYRSLFENANDIIYTRDLAGNFTSINKSGERVIGYNRAEVLQMNLIQLVAPEYQSQVCEALSLTIPQRAQFTDEFELIAKDGRRVALEVSTQTIYDGEKPVGVQGIARDVTERKRLEAQLRQAQKMESIGTLAGGVAHDFNNILTGIIGFAELSLQGLSPEHSLYRNLQEIQRLGDRAAHLTRQLLTFARKQVLEQRPIRLSTVIDDLSHFLQRVIGEHIELKVIQPYELAAVHGDITQIEQVMMNLCINARDAMPQGGTLLIEMQNVHLDASFCQIHPWAKPGHYVCLLVSDTGVGLDRETQERIFDPFFTTKDPGQGTGLGLAIVYGIIQQHHGMIDVYSEIGRGTTFKIYLPAVASVFSPAAASNGAASLAGVETILVVEDEAAVRALIVHVLQTHGYRVATAANGDEALRLLDAHAEPIDLIISDAVMPKMGGHQLYESLRPHRARLKFLLISGYSIHTLNESFLLNENLDFLSKPFKPLDLLHKVREVLDGEGRRVKGKG